MIRNATSPLTFVVERLSEQDTVPETTDIFSLNEASDDQRDDTLENELALAGNNVIESSFLKDEKGL